MDNDNVRCEGWTKRGAFTMGGNLNWRQCKNDAVVSIESVQEGKTGTVPACMACWKEGIEFGIQIIKVTPI